MKIINSLNVEWDWLKEQFALECNRKNPCPFELLSKGDLNLENNERADKYDYLDRAKKYINRCMPEKALADYNKVEEMGYDDNFHFYYERGEIYSEFFNERDKAIADFSKALSIAEESLKQEKEREKPLNIECFSNWMVHALNSRSKEYELKGDKENALTDKNAVINIEGEIESYKEKKALVAQRAARLAAEEAANEEKKEPTKFDEAVSLYNNGEYEKAVKIFKTLARQGHDEAVVKLGKCYDSGYGVKRNDEKAAELWLKVAERGNAEAQSLTGRNYLIGCGVEKDKVKAAHWYRRAAEQGHIESQRSTAYFFAHGTGVEQDYVKAAEWFRKAAEQGHSDAQVMLAEYYFNGIGVEQDYVKAAEWYGICAKQGVTSAMLSYAACYMEGKGVEQDYTKAVELYKKLANYDVEAQYKLGRCYEEGKGVTQDLSQAIKLYQKAVKNKYEPAIERLAELQRGV
jgi:TPR repeat protein